MRQTDSPHALVDAIGVSSCFLPVKTEVSNTKENLVGRSAISLPS